MFKKEKNTNVFTLFVLLMMFTSVINGFDYIGHRFTKTNMPTFYVNSTGTPDCSNEFQAIQTALNTLNAVSTTYTNFQYGGTTTNNNAGVNDGTNLLTWIESGWDTQYPGHGDAIALNITWYIPSTGENLDSDIAFNGDDYLWSDNGVAGKYDVQNIATHELGHSISLGDLLHYGV